MKITIDPRIMYNYATFYLLGIERAYSHVTIKYDVSPFLDIPYSTTEQYRRGMAFIVEEGDVKHKVFIDFSDRCDIMEEQYKWAHLYCKINVRFGDSLAYDKLMVIGPSFGLRIGCLFSNLLLCTENIIRSNGCLHIPKSFFLRDYLYPIFRREKYERYVKEIDLDDNYVFHASTLWYDKDADATTNKYRGDFLQCCKELGVRIGGGLFYIDSPIVLKEFPDYANYLERYREFLCKRRLSMIDYIIETKRSFVVFNTPAVAGCHGWKLPEYLCMGKAIISTPLSREMPGDGLIHGENVHIVNSTKDIYDAISLIREDKSYRNKLMRGAQKYYDDYLAPEVVIRRIFERCKLL